MPIIAYQSFNANASSDHSLIASSVQRFTKDTNAHATGGGHESLVLPHLDTIMDVPVQGPANKVAVQAIGSSQTAEVFGAQIALLWQNAQRALGGMPDIMVCGELDLSHPDFVSMAKSWNVPFETTAMPKACQSFSAISNSQSASQITKLGANEGCVAYAVLGLNVVFVHVPNKIAKDATATQLFYQTIAQSLLTKGNVIDLVIGDTNQGGTGFTADVLNRAFGTNVYQNAGASGSIEKFDAWNVTEGGTNAKGTMMYDIAVYRSDVVELVRGPVYISQSSGSVTVTDHCGLAVEVKRKGS